MICDHCLAPDTLSGAGIGCDNMTILIVAILNGRTKEEWYTWVKQRVNDNYGYPTPNSLPTLYSASRLASFRARKEAQERRQLDDRQGSRVLTENGITNDNSSLMFGSNDDEEDYSGDEESHEDDQESHEDDKTNASSSFSSQTFGLGHSDSLDMLDATKHLKEQLDEYEKDIRQEDGDGETSTDATDEGSHPLKDSGVSLQPDPTGEPPSKSLPNGNPSPDSQEQLKSHPHDDQPELAEQGSNVGTDP